MLVFVFIRLDSDQICLARVYMNKVRLNVAQKKHNGAFTGVFSE